MKCSHCDAGIPMSKYNPATLHSNGQLCTASEQDVFADKRLELKRRLLKIGDELNGGQYKSVMSHVVIPLVMRCLSDAGYCERAVSASTEIAELREWFDQWWIKGNPSADTSKKVLRLFELLEAH